MKSIKVRSLIVVAMTLGSSMTFLNCGSGLSTSGDNPDSATSIADWIGMRMLGVASQDTQGLGIAVDSSNNVFVGGFTKGGLDGNTVGGTTDAFVTRYDAAGTKQWTRQFGASAKLVNCNGLATDSTGQVYLAGTTNTGLHGNPLTGTSDFFLAKYDTAGIRQWTRQLGVGSGSTAPGGVAAGSSGFVYVVGATSGDLDGQTHVGNSDVFLTQYDTAGIKKWTRLHGVASTTTLGARVAVDTAGSVYIVGQTGGNLAGASSLTGAADSFVSRYDSTGARLWTKMMGVSARITKGRALTITPSGGVCIAGESSGPIDGNTGVGSLNSNYDAFIICYNSAGTKLWSTLIGAPNENTYGYGLTVDAAGNLYLSGSTEGSIAPNSEVGTEDFYIAKFNSAGTRQWVRQLGAAGKRTLSTDVVVDLSAGNRIFTTGYTLGSLDGETLIGVSDAFTRLYDPAGIKK